jgi:hypothetical protein
MRLTTIAIASVAFLAGQGWAWIYTEGSLAPSAMAAAPQCVTEEPNWKPDIRYILSSMPAEVQRNVTSGSLPPPVPRAKPDAIGQLIGGL